MKIGPRNKWRKAIQVSTDSLIDAYYLNLMWSSIDSSIDSSATAQSIDNYDFRISKSKIRSNVAYLFKVGLF